MNNAGLSIEGAVSTLPRTKKTRVWRDAVANYLHKQILEQKLRNKKRAYKL